MIKIKKILFLSGVGLFCLFATSCGREFGRTDLSQTNTAESDAEHSKEALTQGENAPSSDILSAGPGSAQFPDMNIVVPTTEPAPGIIRIGTRSWIIKDLQARLMELGFMDNDEPSDYYGETTAAAVKIYQRQNNLSQDEIVGEETLKAILDENAKYYTAKQGDSGTDIVELQRRLYQLGYLAGEDEISGNFGEKTLAAVKKFQLMNGLSSDGKVGRQSMNLIYSEDVKANLIALGEKSDLVLAAQKRLRELGYLMGEPDGNFGLGTSKALKSFQSRNDEIVDGYLGPGTREKLNSSTAKPFGLVIGDQGDDVTDAQKLLNKWGYLNSGFVTGYYGEKTKQAVVAFQRRNDLDPDGSVGKKTMAKLSGNQAKRPAARSANTSGASQSASGAGTANGNASGGASSKSGSAYSYTGGGSVGALLDIAGSKLGCPYIWGAKGPGAFDCSGFVYWCLNQVGVGQSYMTSGGWASGGRGRRISSFSELQAGDIICVRGHVGICAGGGTVIDASSSNGGVVHRSLGSWWQRNFICGWRIF